MYFVLCIGYAEKHAKKSEDSFNTFEEILQLAHAQEVDFVLLGGDLFHENKPSRNSVIKCMDLLRKYTLGDREIKIAVLSRPDVDFAHCSRQEVNYVCGDLNVSMPVFSIHGNHDDPTGQGARTILDELHIAGLLNYFGRIDNMEHIEVSPMLLKKGN